MHTHRKTVDTFDAGKNNIKEAADNSGVLQVKHE